MIKISFIIPVYNTEKGILVRCLKSIVDHGYEDYEIIIVDDGSNEKYQNIFSEVENIDCHIKIIHKENSSTVYDSFCNLAIPAAYLIRSNRDANYVMKNWPSDQKVDEIIKLLAKNTYYTIDKLNMATTLVAHRFSLDESTLSVMVQCLLADKVIDLKRHGYKFEGSFDETVANLFKLLT